MSLFGQYRSRIAIMDQELVNFVEFDALVKATYSGGAQITDHPVESLKDVTDHIRPTPVEMQLQGIVSDHPVLALASFRATPAVPGTDPSARAEAAFYFLESMRQTSSLAHVFTSLWELENMVITSLSCTRDKDSSRIVDISLTLREIEVAKTEVIAIEVKAKTNIGKKGKAPVSAPMAVKAQSILSKLFSAFGG